MLVQVMTAFYGDDADKGFADNEQREATSTHKEDSEDIDTLLIFYEDEHDECDEEEVSTAMTYMNCGSNSPDSCSNYESPPRKIRLTSLKKISGCTGSGCSERKRLKMRKMVRALKRNCRWCKPNEYSSCALCLMRQISQGGSAEAWSGAVEEPCLLC